MYRVISLFLFLGGIALNSYTQNKVFQPILNYTGDVVANLSGGDKRTVQWMGVLDAGFLFDTEVAGFWKGGQLNMELISTQGKGFSATVLHDQQGISGIEAGNHPLVMWELWYHQQLGKFGVRGGLQNINSDFMNQPFTDAFSGGSYSMFPTLALNYSLADYPVAGLGISFFYQINKNWEVLTSLFNGTVPGIDHENRMNMSWRLNPKRDGVLSITEAKYISDSTQFPACMYGLGMVYHSRDFASLKDKNRSYKNNYALYAFAEHDFYQSSMKNAGVFLQGSYAPANRNMAYGYLALGVTANGFFTRSHTDVAGIGMSQVYYQEVKDNILKRNVESAIEAYIRYKVNKYLTVKPTLFVIVSSSRTTITAGMIEFGLNVF